MKRILLPLISILGIFVFPTYGNTGKPFIVSPFIDFGYDVSADNSYDYTYDYNSYTRDGTNLCLGVNFYRKPLYLQLQIANYLNYLKNDGDVFGIVKIGMNEEMYKNGFFDMNFSYTDNFSQYIYYSAYSGSVGYYHLFMPIDTLYTAYFSFGINLGFVNHNYREWYSVDPGWSPYPYYSTNQTEMFTIAEFAWIDKYIRPYLAFGLQNMANNDYYISPRNSGFFSIGIQAHLDNVFPYFSGNQSKMTYYKHNNYHWVAALKPNIYLYPELKTQAKVTLIPNKGNEITASAPSYKNGWNVSVEPSGLIDNKYEYLFYEGSKIKFKPNGFGWSIPASDLWQLLSQKMVEYGFNEKEIKDFDDYWEIHLPKSKFYDIIPLVNQEVENEFGLVVEPKPDKVIRVWFYINPAEKQNKLEPPPITKFDRKGFTVTEWGVLLNR